MQPSLTSINFQQRESLIRSWAKKIKVYLEQVLPNKPDEPNFHHGIDPLNVKYINLAYFLCFISPHL